MKRLTKHTDTSRAFLVALDGTHVLVDACSERLLVLDDTAAAVWSDLAEGRAPSTRQGMAFATRLVEQGLLDGLPDQTVAPTLDGPEPMILAEAPLQVAANTSDPDPFSADAIW